jgi:transcriptional regulator with XRE-family HTH domain
MKRAIPHTAYLQSKSSLSGTGFSCPNSDYRGATVGERKMNKRFLMGRRLKELRQRSGLSQEQLAEKARTSPNYVSRMERGTENPTFNMLLKLSHALDIKPLELFDFMHQENPKVLKRTLRKLAGQIEDAERLKIAVRLLQAVTDSAHKKRKTQLTRKIKK